MQSNRKVIDTAITLDETMDGFMFCRLSDGGLSISLPGYKTMDFHRAVESLLKAGARFDFQKGSEEFDKLSGRTFSHFKNVYVVKGVDG